MSEKNVNKFFLVFFFTLISIFNVKSTTIDSLENQYNLPYPYISNSSSGLFMNQPSNLNFKTIYDPVTNQYLIQKRLGEYKLGKPEILSFEEFQKYKKKHPNWEMELKPNAKPEGKKTAPLVTKAQKNNEGIPQGIEALEASLNKERMAQAVEMFEKLDKNKDGKITVPEVPAKQFEKKVWVQANLNGDMILTWEEELIWQYNFQRKKAKQK